MLKKGLRTVWAREALGWSEPLGRARDASGQSGQESHKVAVVSRWVQGKPQLGDQTGATCTKSWLLPHHCENWGKDFTPLSLSFSTCRMGS